MTARADTLVRIAFTSTQTASYRSIDKQSNDAIWLSSLYLIYLRSVLSTAVPLCAALFCYNRQFRRATDSGVAAVLEMAAAATAADALHYVLLKR
jgi:hypothetical protein